MVKFNAMTAALTIVFIISIFLILSYWVHGLLLKSKKSKFWILTFLYFLITYGLFELTNFIHIQLREHGFNLEFGHASLLLVMASLFCIIVALLNVGLVVFKRYKQGPLTS